jgi:hypothetical protein
LHCLAKSPKSAHAHWVVGKWEPFRNDIALSKLFSFTNHPMRMCEFRVFCYAAQWQPWKRSIENALEGKLFTVRAPRPLSRAQSHALVALVKFEPCGIHQSFSLINWRCPPIRKIDLKFRISPQNSESYFQWTHGKGCEDCFMVQE